MAISYKILGQAAPANNTNVTVYTVPTGKQAIISSILFISGDAGGNRIMIHALKSGQTANEFANKIYHVSGTITGLTNYQFTDRITLGPGESIAIYQNTSGEASGVITIFGTEMDI